MLPQVQSVVSKVLEGKHFRYSIDLGCGWGEAGPILRKHTSFLVGVDRNPEYLKVAAERTSPGGSPVYDRIIQYDLRYYPDIIPPKVDSVFLFDIIEHLKLLDGKILLTRLQNTPFLMLTTPSKFFPIARDGHVTLWTEEELSKYGFRTAKFPIGWLTMFNGNEIIGVKG